MINLFQIIITPGIAFLLNMLIIPLILHISHRYKWYDSRNHRTIHSGDIPRIGGLGIFFSFIIAVAAIFFIVSRPILNNSFRDVASKGIPMFAGLIIIHIAGLIDDFSDLKASFKFLIQLAAAIVVTLGGYGIGYIILPFTWQEIPIGFFVYPLSWLWITLITNTINLVDGIDGLAAGIAAIAAFFIGLSSLFLNHLTVGFISFSFFGCLVAFLIFNFPPAKIFMGDCGSLLIGFILSVLPLLSSRARISSLALIPMFTLLLIPILDTVFSIIRRLKGGRSILSADRGHLHHKLLDLGLSQKQILLIVYSACIIAGLTTLNWTLNPNKYSLIFVFCIWALYLFAMIVLDIIHNRKITNQAGTH
jgi:UDP-GlcNAc:undecaprenyl-phosphate/decaprenyl-phosphate GlcNAc-1-phosphate transferase